MSTFLVNLHGDTLEYSKQAKKEAFPPPSPSEESYIYDERLVKIKRLIDFGSNREARQLGREQW